MVENKNIIMRDYIYDTETYPNVFTMSMNHVKSDLRWNFEISPWRDDSRDLLDFMYYLKSQNARMVGFNNIGFDYPVLHTLIRMGRASANILYQKAMAIINSQNEEGDDRWVHQVYPGDRLVEQLDLYKIHHFDNKARSTSLKALEFNMRAASIEDLPFPVGTELTQDQVPILKKYNAYDVEQTKAFYHESLDMIRFREELTHKYNRDFMNHNDTKIGKDYFIMKLEEAGVACYDFSRNGRTPKQTRRPVIHLREAILPWIEFENPEFTRVLNWLKAQSITETKGVFKDLTATVNGFTFVFGLGGIHGSVENQSVESDDGHSIVDLDVASFYPNLAISNGFYPHHLGSTFVSIYKHLFEQRKGYAKKSAENAMLKLALNGVYGDSNNQFSVFYDPQFTMSITLNGQLLICLLAEWLMKIPGLQMIQVNTDGLTVKIPNNQILAVEQVREAWEKRTRLQLEEAFYKRMFIRDVNNYLAEYEKGGIKRKGAYEYDLEWHQDASALVVPKVTEKVLLDGVGIRETLETWPDIMDFMIRVKVPRSSHLTTETKDGTITKIQNTTRYYVAKGGVHLYKWMPPLKGKTEWRKMAVSSGWGVEICNDLNDHSYMRSQIDLDYYQQEIEKLCLRIM